MAEDKYAPKAGDDYKEVHKKHKWLISDQKAANKREREKANKPKVSNPHEAPENPDAPQNQPVTEDNPS